MLCYYLFSTCRCGQRDSMNKQLANKRSKYDDWKAASPIAIGKDHSIYSGSLFKGRGKVANVVVTSFMTLADNDENS
jgi:hypothetical protein